MYQQFFIEASKVLKKGGRIAVVVPFFKTKEGNAIIPVKELLPHVLKVYNPLADILDQGFPLEYEERKIGRMIYVLKKI